MLGRQSEKQRERVGTEGGIYLGYGSQGSATLR